MTDPEQSDIPAMRSYVWLVFASFGLLFIVYGIYAFTLQYLQPAHWQFLTFDRDTADYIGGKFRWLGMVSFGFGILTIAISYGSFRRGDKWAWYAFTLYPIFWLIAIPVTWPGLMHLPFAVVSIAALWIARRSAFGE